MRVFRDLSELENIENAVITIGSFDGVHIGHQKIISRLKQLSNETNSENFLITFDPHPRSVIYPKDKTLRLLSSRKEKIALFEKYGLDNVVIIPFTIEFSQISAQEYIDKFLVKYFKPKYIVIGYDHKFGINRSGDLQLLNSVKNKYGFEVIEIPKQEIDEITISSTKIRNAIINGNLSGANTLLNHPYSLSGKVIYGRKLGTEIGFPTANLKPEEPKKLIPKDGIYACKIEINGDVYKGMLYIGDIPTIGTDNPKSIEVNIFDFDQDIYGERISVKILRFLREDQKFEGLNDLKKQLKKDRESAIDFFRTYEDLVNANTSIVILNYNTKHYLETFLPSVSFSSQKPFDTIVIDNASSDESVKFVNDWFPEVKTIELNQNHGFAKGYNLGLNEINSKYLVLLNSDVEVTPNWLDPLIDYLDTNDDCAAVMPKIRSLENKDAFEYAGAAGGFIDIFGYPFCRGRIFDTVENDTGQYDNPKEIFWASGAALVIKKDVFNKLGGFDDDYFAHHEEIDLCWRIHNAGYKIMVLPESTVYHVGGGTLNYGNSRKIYLNFRNSLYTLFKNESILNLIFKVPCRLALDGIAAIKFLFSGEVKSTLAVLKAHFSFYGQFLSLLKKRKKLKSQIKNTSIGSPNKNGMVRLSIIWNYYIKRKKKYSDIFKD
ncbi:MAG: bifunctional riboflavin kinase/FAD synthetase [Bacteroidia bacterium]|nr:bifunctional riboflavin kinase/FAD synthetase [Bacteroidia bacterium]